MKNTFVQMIKFYIVGASGVFVNLIILYLLTNFLGLWYLFSAIFGIIISVTTNFLGNKIWTFKIKDNKIKHYVKKYINFWVASLVGIIIQLILLYILVHFFDIWYLLAAFIAIVIASFSNFLFSKFWVFKYDKYSNTNI